MMSPLPLPEFLWKLTLYKALLVLTQGKYDTLSNHNRVKKQPGYKGKKQKNVLASIHFTCVKSKDPACRPRCHFR